MEEGLVDIVVESLGEGVEPDDAFSSIEVDEAEPVVLVETRALADAEGPVRIDGDAIAAKHEHASQAGRGPLVGGGAKGSVVDASRRYGEDLAIWRDVVEYGALVVGGKRRDCRGGRSWVRVGHGDVVQGSSGGEIE